MQTARPPLASGGCGWALRVLKQGCWRRGGSFELRNFTSRRQQDLSFKSAPTPPFAGFNVSFEDLMLNTSAGAPLSSPD